MHVRNNGQNVLILGGTGFIGRALSKHLSDLGFKIRILTRHKDTDAIQNTTYTSYQWDGSTIPSDAIQGVKAVVNLAGQPIADHRWSVSYKEEILQSRLRATKALTDAISKLEQKPETVIQASAIGYYGTLVSTETCDESSSPGSDFLATVCQSWEQRASPLASSCRLVIPRFGLVLGRDGGVWPVLWKTYSIGLGSILADGHQWMNGIHISDLVRFIGEAINDTSYRGVYNLVAPKNIENRLFHKTLCKYTISFSKLKMPNMFLELALGERASLLLKGPHIQSTALQKQGFLFEYPNMQDAMMELLSDHVKACRLKPKNGVIFYDSDCLMCNSFVNFVAGMDKEGIFRFTSTSLLQTDPADNLSYLKKTNERTILLLYKGHYYRKSLAILKILNILNWKFRILTALFSLVPLFLLDAVYSVISKYRRVLFRKTESCMMKKNSSVPARLVKHTRELEPYLSFPQPVFISAQWKNLLMINYKIDSDLLKPFLPVGTELDKFDNSSYLSIVCFQYLNAKVRGLSIPFHRKYEEIHLRFYVKRKRNERWERGVVFIKSFVTKPAIAWIANTLCKENYQLARMKSSLDRNGDTSLFAHSWTTRNATESTIKVAAKDEPKLASPGSIQEYIAEHNLGYVVQPDGSAKEYQVRRPPWRIWHDCDVQMKVDFKNVYGENFVFLETETPAAVFVAEGSLVSVHQGADIYF